MMGFIIEKENIKNPEDVLFSMFESDSHKALSKESNREFMVKGIFLMVFMVIMYLGAREVVPGIMDIIAVLLIGLVTIPLLVKLTEMINQSTKIGLKGIFLSIAFLTLALIFVGGFV